MHQAGSYSDEDDNKTLRFAVSENRAVLGALEDLANRSLVDSSERTAQARYDALMVVQSQIPLVPRSWSERHVPDDWDLVYGEGAAVEELISGLRWDPAEVQPPPSGRVAYPVDAITVGYGEEGSEKFTYDCVASLPAENERTPQACIQALARDPKEALKLLRYLKARTSD
jgi:hypothetical protein